MDTAVMPDLLDQLGSSDVDQMTEHEAEEAMRKTRNAILQKPISHLEARRDMFQLDGVDLFSEVNPTQVAQALLSIIGDHMLLHDGIELGTCERLLARYISRLDPNRTLDEKQRIIAARRVIDAVRNKQDDYRVYSETITNPLTGAREVLEFKLIVSEPRDEKPQSDIVYRLTEDGARLLLVMWASAEEIDMMNLFIKDAINKGEFEKALAQLKRQQQRATMVVSRLGDILRDLGRLDYDKGFDEEIKVLLESSSAEIEEFEKDAITYRDAVARAKESDSLEPHSQRALFSLEEFLNELREINANMRSTLFRVLHAFKREQERRIRDIGLRSRAPDIPNDFLKPIAVEETAILAEHAMADRLATVFLPARCPPCFDPFVVFEQAPLRDLDDAEAPDPLDINAVMIEPDDNYKVRELNHFYDIISETIFSREQGVSLEELYRAVKADPNLSERYRRGIMHSAALFHLDKDEQRSIKKVATGEQIDNEYIVGEDVRILPVWKDKDQ